MDKLVAKQEARYDRLLKSYSNYKKTPKERIKVAYVESRLESLEKLWLDFFEQHLEAYSVASDKERNELEYFKQDKITSFEEMYTDHKTKLKEDLRALTSVTSIHSCSHESTHHTTSTPSCEVKLPQIQLPMFSGNYEDWQAYYDMFISVIHNNESLSAVQKLHYLKGSLSGEPANLLKNLATTDANYSEAWSQLIRRYNNKRYNCNEIMKRLFAQKNLMIDSANGVKQILDTTSGCLKSLNNLGVETKEWDTIINHLVLTRLDQETRKLWEMHIGGTESDELPTWQQLMSFLESRFRTLEMTDTSRSIHKSTNNIIKKQGSKQNSFHVAVRDEKNTMSLSVCGMCTGQHPLYQCKQFAKQSPEERSHYVQSQRLCFNCLSPTHGVRSCRQSSCCRRCGRRHHSLLHMEKKQESNLEHSESNRTPIINDSEQKVVAHFTKDSKINKVLLATARVRAKSVTGYSQTVRVLIDQGSEASFITEATVQALGLKRNMVSGLVSGVGESQTRTKGMVILSLESLHDPEFCVQVNAFVLRNLTSFLPSSNLAILDWPEINALPLADPKFGSPDRIDMILGADVHGEILKEGLLRHPTEECPIAQNTHFGWVLSGRVHKNLQKFENMFINLHIQVSTDELLRQFWEIEREPESLIKKLTKEERRCEEIYAATTIRDNDGRYTVRLPFKGPNPECLYGGTRNIALRRFQFLEKRLLKQPTFHESYKKAIEDYLEQGHMKQITTDRELSDPFVVYLPHHAVVKEDKETTKLRPVFDASCKGLHNKSLNDNLLVGPKLQQDLRHILMRWRRHKICIVADLMQMYRQICVDERDTDFQRLFWRARPDQSIQHFKLLRLTFGTACAPYLAVRTLQQLAKDEQSTYPLAAKITLEDYYMDDLLTGCETYQEAVNIFEQMTKLMKSGGFTLQKWGSNSENLLKYIKEEVQENDKTLTFKINDTVKVLGISWNQRSDNFEYTLKMPTFDDSEITKRKVLSDVARLYDPIGWIAPIIVTAKIYIQTLWKSGLSWDEPLPSELLEEWHTFRSDLRSIEDITIPRWLNSKTNDHVELHAFADASQLAYAAVIYMKTKDKEGKTHVNLITAKTKVAPVEKQISIPRLELCAALLATKLTQEVSEIMQVPKNNLFGWTDSTIVLAWLTGEPSRWNTFVSNRVSEILTILERPQWGHVNTHQNPADCASRGIRSSELLNNELWWHGPNWLSITSDYEIGLDGSGYITDEEQKPIKNFSTTVSRTEDFEWNRFSSLSKALRILAYCRRFLRLRIPKEKRSELTAYITVEEMNDVLRTWVRETQHFYFESEVKQLTNKSQGSVAKKSPLHTLCPIFDDNGILRVGGRIHQAPVEYSVRHPIILPSESHLTKLLILDAHIKTMHGGPQLMLNYLRSKYWIIRARHLTKKCYRQCVTCIRYSRQNNCQLMGQLPEIRITPTRAFEVSGVDFTGYINLRFSPGRGSKTYKGYICLFICMTSKAIHLEAVSDLTAKGFIAAFRRFVSRRGHCKHMYSDNGTNFLGADKELRLMFTKAVSQLPNEIAKFLAGEGTTWHFIPPHAPNFGGLWEAGVRSAKSHLKRILGNSTATFEELSTILAQIEACLNSRPLSYMSNNADDPLPLTPGHFLVGEPLIVIPDEDHTKSHISGLQRWKIGQKMINDFWRKWSNEYLVSLNQRFKWTTKKSEPEIEDIVVIKDHNLPPAKWLLGKIVEKHTGKDNVTRVVTIKTANGYCKRPCNKLCFLPRSE